MADFSTPFSELGEQRPATPDERDLGFPCGPADRTLFNRLFYRLEAEVGHVIEYAGIAPTDDRMTQLREAIQALIAAALGTADTTDYVLMSQARARLPIFPDVQTVTGRMGITSTGAGNVRVPGGVTFQHRGIFPITTAVVDLVTNPSKIYHLRWRKATGVFALFDISSGVYNPSALAENNIAFDSTYDDMLVARVVTNSSNVPVITDLANKHAMSDEREYVSNAGEGTVGVGWYGTPTDDAATYEVSHFYNWARTPTVDIDGWNLTTSDKPLQGTANWLITKTVDRYFSYGKVMSDHTGSMTDDLPAMKGRMRFLCRTV